MKKPPYANICVFTILSICMIPFKANGQLFTITPDSTYAFVHNFSNVGVGSGRNVKMEAFWELDLVEYRKGICHLGLGTFNNFLNTEGFNSHTWGIRLTVGFQPIERLQFKFSPGLVLRGHKGRTGVSHKFRIDFDETISFYTKFESLDSGIASSNPFLDQNSFVSYGISLRGKYLNSGVGLVGSFIFMVASAIGNSR